MTLYVGKTPVCPTRVVFKEVGAKTNNQDITVTENGTYTADEGYTGLGTVDVQVPNPSTGTLNIVENGSYNVTEYATAEVNVPTGGGGAPATRLGMTIENRMGYTVNGVYYPPTPANFDGSSITHVDMAEMEFLCAGPHGVGGTFDMRNIEKITGSWALRYVCYWAHALKVARFDSLTEISGLQALEHGFENCTILEEVVWPNLKTVSGVGALAYAFASCSKLKRTGLYGLETISGGLNYSYQSCSALEETNLNNLKRIDGQCYGTFQYCKALKDAGLDNLEVISVYPTQMFGGCTSLVSAYMPKLVRMDVDANTMNIGMFASLTSLTEFCLDSFEGGNLNNTFKGCSKLTKGYFPMLTDVTATTLAPSTSSSYGCFASCTGITELHFRADTQEKIEAANRYSSKFGATNATIYFDLIGTITVNGVAYARDEKQSIRVDKVKTFVAWKDENENVIYTSYENNTEPAVGTPVYSDAGTTQVGTVEGVA